jgi:hypothetical protein
MRSRNVCWYEKGAGINQFLEEKAALERAALEANQLTIAKVNRERKLVVLQRLAADPRTPTGEAQAAHLAIHRLQSKG